MGESELVISLDENSGNFDVPDNTKIQRNLQHMQKLIFSRHTIMSNQLNMSTNRDFISDRPDCLVGSNARSEGRSVVGHVFQKLDVDETCQSINEEELFGEGDEMKIGPVGRKDYGDENRNDISDENRNDISDGQSTDEDNSLFKKMSSQQRDPKYPEWNLLQMSVSSEQDTTSQRRSRFRDSKDLEVIKDSVYADEISGTSQEAPGLEPSSGMPDIIKSSSGSSLSSSAASMTLLQQQSPDVLNAHEADVFSKFSDEPDGSSQWHEKYKEKLEKKMYIEGMSHYPVGMSKPCAVHYSPSMFGQNTENPADEKRGRFRSSGYGTDSKQSQNSQNSMEGSAFDGVFEKNDLGSTVINRRGSKGLGRPQIDSAFSEESGQQYESAVSVPYLSIFNLSEVSHDSPPNDFESLCGNLPNIAALLEMETCDDDESVAVTNCVIPHAIDERVAGTNSDIQHAIDASVAIQHAIDASVAVTNSVIQRVNEGDPKDKDLIEVQQNYCLSSSLRKLLQALLNQLWMLMMSLQNVWKRVKIIKHPV
ncbi:hypothetical protein CHS0354_035923 [Potamilus streckersoni]|uniref:Uncharacterized protein n=1 Tax=Potamilus streckersoni TaxID=2493646 RepID=A0AAE0SFP2_9BIVA|nr:hypothetical protein CHS0354_035923 [Potamilus streckersoni]